MIKFSCKTIKLVRSPQICFFEMFARFIGHKRIVMLIYDLFTLDRCLCLQWGPAAVGSNVSALVGCSSAPGPTGTDGITVLFLLGEPGQQNQRSDHPAAAGSLSHLAVPRTETHLLAPGLRLLSPIPPVQHLPLLTARGRLASPRRRHSWTREVNGSMIFVAFLDTLR